LKYVFLVLIVPIVYQETYLLFSTKSYPLFIHIFMH
jgi:hypothetical protein